MGFSLGMITGLLAAVFATSVLSGILGMAGGMVLMGILAWALDVRQAMILHAIAQFGANASRAWLHRAHIRWDNLIPYFIGTALVFSVFVFVSYVPGKLTVFLMLGLSPFLAAMLPKNLRLDFNRKPHALLCGAIVTLFQLSAGVAGPMLDVFFQAQTMPRHATVATKALTQAFSHCVKFAYFTLVVTGHSAAMAGVPLWLALLVVPVALLGTRASKTFLDRLSDKHFYRATQSVLFLIGGFYLVKAAILLMEFTS